MEGECLCHWNYLDTSYSVSSSRTYVEESDILVFNGEEEDLSGGKVRRPEEKVEERADLSANTTKAPLSWASCYERANEPEEDDERCYVGNSESLNLVEMGSRADNRQNESNSGQEGRLAVEKENHIGVNLHGLSEEEVAKRVSQIKPNHENAS
ncbi:hypothetical protein ACSQ67_025637 [Phaseolus vulgaris]